MFVLKYKAENAIKCSLLVFLAAMKNVKNKYFITVFIFIDIGIYNFDNIFKQIIIIFSSNDLIYFVEICYIIYAMVKIN